MLNVLLISRFDSTRKSPNHSFPVVILYCKKKKVHSFLLSQILATFLLVLISQSEQFLETVSTSLISLTSFLRWDTWNVTSILVKINIFCNILFVNHQHHCLVSINKNINQSIFLRKTILYGHWMTKNGLYSGLTPPIWNLLVIHKHNYQANSVKFCQTNFKYSATNLEEKRFNKWIIFQFAVIKDYCKTLINYHSLELKPSFNEHLVRRENNKCPSQIYLSPIAASISV